jgi:hypothetical protein
MKSIPFIILFALIVGLASGQEAAIEQKVQYNNIPANFSTGSPNISIPLWTASGKSLSTPIVLSYATNGVRVTSEPGDVGLSWELVAGGSITQLVRSRNDFEVGVAYDILNNGYELGENTANTEHDLYNINVAGISTQFFIDSLKQPRTVTESNLRIRFIEGADEDDSRFIVTDANGNNYYFDKVLLNYSVNKFDEFNNVSEPDTIIYEPRNIICAGFSLKWLLTKIENYNKTDEIIFEYSEKAYKNNTAYQKLCRGRKRTGYTYFTEDVEEQIKLKKIRTATQEVIFDISDIDTTTSDYDKYINHYALRDSLALADYTDVDKVLKSITVNDGSGNAVREFRFDYEFGGQNYNFNNRIFLKEVTEYDGTGSNATSFPPYQFDYFNIHALPSIYNTNYDYWGFYNGTSGRYPKTNFISNGMLSSITYPTGSITTYQYQPNTYYFPLDVSDEWYSENWKKELEENMDLVTYVVNPDSIVLDSVIKIIDNEPYVFYEYVMDTIYNNRSLQGPGVHLSTIKKYENANDTNPLVTEMEYGNEEGSSGRLSYYPILEITYEDGQDTRKIKSLFSQNIEQGFVTYKKLVVFNGGKTENGLGKNGRIEYNFNVLPDFSSLPINGIVRTHPQMSNYYWTRTKGTFPFSFKLFPKQLNGLLLQKKVYDNANRAVTEEISNYSYKAETTDNIYMTGARLYFKYNEIAPDNYICGVYRLYPLRVRLNSMTTRKFIDGNESNYLETTKLYEYERGTSSVLVH